MTVVVYTLAYAGTLAFLVGCAVRAIRYATLPPHLRWELYPVPHEDPAVAGHGGSYFEEVDWWTRPAHFNYWGEAKFMVPEILLLRGLWEFNRKLWLRSFPFHFGLYLLGATIVLLVAGATELGRITGFAGLALALLGAVGLLIGRLTDVSLRNYTAPGDIFNLVFFIAALGLLLAGCLLAPAGFAGVFARGLLTFDTSVSVPAPLAAGLMLASVLAAYIPLTHMSHFIAKYFTYHSIRWDDKASVHSAALAKKIAQCLAYRPTWGAAHIGADGRKSWAEIATTNPAAGTKK